MSDDDLQWLEALSGRDGPASSTRREALALRTALKRMESAEAAVTPSDDVSNRSRENTLIARARHEGLLPAATPRRLAGWKVPLAAGILLAFGAVMVTQLRDPAGTPVLRGEEGIVRLESIDPTALKQILLAELRAAGASATGYESLDVSGIDADLPLPLSAELKRVLEAHGIPEPEDGVLHIEIRSSQ